MEKGLVERVAKDFNIQLSQYRITTLEAELAGQDVSYDTVQHLVLRAYDGMGPQGLNGYVRLTDEEHRMLKECIEFFSDGVQKVKTRDIFVYGFKEALIHDVEKIPTPQGREHKPTFRINKEIDTLFKKVIAKYSSPVSEISNPTALLIALYAAHSKITKEMKVG